MKLGGFVNSFIKYNFTKITIYNITRNKTHLLKLLQFCEIRFILTMINEITFLQ